MKSRKEFILTNEAVEISGLCDKTLRSYADRGLIGSYRTEGGQRRFRREDIEILRNGEETEKAPVREVWKVAYARVSSKKQSDDLERQKAYLSENYPEHQIISDVGSGINFQRKGFGRILTAAISGVQVDLVVAHRDRLCRFGYDLVQFIIEEKEGTIICAENPMEKSREEELAEDLMAIVQVFNCRSNGRRRYQNKGGN